MPDLYLHRLIELIEGAGATNDAALDDAAEHFAATLADGGLVHLYGSGHSVLPCQEAFPRYGSFVGFNPLTDPRTMWNNVLGAGGVRELLWLERTEGYVDKFLAHQPLNEGDCLVVYSHSGRNAAGIDTALYAKQRGLFVVAVSCAAMLQQPASHSSGQRLGDVADVLIDTTAPVEDAIVPVEGWSRPVSGASTVMAMILTHELLARTATALARRGIELPTFASPTIPGVTLGDTDQVYAVYAERMLAAHQRHLPAFRDEMGGPPT
jgi:uncharacterized phosphosugar-binding protein